MNTMKILLSLLLFPLLIVAQPDYFPPGEYVEVQFSFNMPNQNFSEVENLDGLVEISVTIEVFYTEHLYPKTSPTKSIPKHLNSLSLAGSYQHTDYTQKYQKRLNSLLAVNDVNQPTERSFTNWLKPVPFESKTITPAQNIMEGFGARVSL